MQQQPSQTPPGGTPRPYQPAIDDSQAITPPRGTQRPKLPGKQRQAVTAAMIFAIIACVLTANISLSAGGGALAGQRDRNVQATQTTVAEIDLQYQLALSDISEGRYGIAAQRLRWILEREPEYPGASEQLAQAEQEITSSAFQPTVPPSGSDQPEQLLQEAQAFADEEEWPSTLARLEELQSIAPDYEREAVLELTYTAQQALGLIYVQGDRIEEGLFLLDQASTIRPLTDQAEGERNLAELYSEASIYIDLDWAVVVENYQLIYNLAPNYRNFPLEFQQARSAYAQQLEDDGLYCDAVVQYELGLQLFADPDPLIEDRLEDAEALCGNGGVSATSDPEATGTSGTATPEDDDEDGMISPSDLEDDDEEDNLTRTPTATVNPLIPTPILPGN